MDLLVTIRCITYNHEPYIRQCLDGFVMQKTNFRFEAIVHDDASTDGTADIIREYAEKYPDIIKPILESENQYSKHDGSLSRIMNEHTHGKYVALCEGDDYWTDPYKLQKQVDFLESHPDYSLCFHNAIVHWEKGERKDSLFVKSKEYRDYTGKEILKEWTIPTASVLLRSQVFESDIYKTAKNDKRFIYGDIVLFLSAACLGKMRYINHTMSVYRKHEGGVVYTQNYEHRKKLLAHYDGIKSIFGLKYKRICNKYISSIYYSFFQEKRKMNNKINNIKILIYSFYFSPSNFLQRLTESFAKRSNLHVYK